MVKITSYNCNSFRNNLQVISNLMANNDIVLLQELMLMKSDVSVLDIFNDDFNYVACVDERERATV